MELFLTFLKAFAVGGAICTIAQLLINYTKITSGKILVTFLLAGALLQAFGLYQYVVDFAGAGGDRSDFGLRLSACKGRDRGGERGLVRRNYRRYHRSRRRHNGGNYIRLSFCRNFQSKV